MMFRLLDSIMRASSAMQADISLAVLHRGMCVVRNLSAIVLRSIDGSCVWSLSCTYGSEHRTGIVNSSGHLSYFQCLHTSLSFTLSALWVSFCCFFAISESIVWVAYNWIWFDFCRAWWFSMYTEFPLGIYACPIPTSICGPLSCFQCLPSSLIYMFYTYLDFEAHSHLHVSHRRVGRLQAPHNFIPYYMFCVVSLW